MIPSLRPSLIFDYSCVASGILHWIENCTLAKIIKSISNKINNWQINQCNRHLIKAELMARPDADKGGKHCSVLEVELPSLLFMNFALKGRYEEVAEIGNPLLTNAKYHNFHRIIKANMELAECASEVCVL